MTERFADKTVLVTGASRGLGRDIAVAFGAEGAHVYVAFCHREADAEATVKAIEDAGGTGSSIALDVRSRSAVDTAVKTIFSERDRLDVLVNNAAVVRDNHFPLLSEEEWDDVISVNLHGTFRLCRAVARPMIGRRHGAIVNIASVAGIAASPGQTAYAASKGGVIAFTRTLAAELGPEGVRVNAVVPGLLTTGMGARLDRRFAAGIEERVALRRRGEGREVAEVVMFLASDAASYVVGQAVVVDGGLTL